jgi:hypothetical protein
MKSRKQNKNKERLYELAKSEHEDRQKLRKNKRILRGVKVIKHFKRNSRGN